MSKPQRRAYTALVDFVAPDESRPGDESPPWILLKQRPGQLDGEIYGFALTVYVVTLAMALDQLLQLLDPGFAGWHYLWVLPAAVLVQFAALHLVTLASVFIGRALAAIGILRQKTPPQRTSFYFLLALTTAAAIASGCDRPLVKWPSMVWLALVGANIVAHVLLAMRSAERPKNRPTR